LSYASVRREDIDSAEEWTVIRGINVAAFGGREEADLVDKLRAGGDVLESLVAELNNRLVGHVLFSRMWIDGAGELIPSVALAPIAVLPEYQRSGVGTRLIEQGLVLLRDRGEKIVIVVGHPDYYPRFGFSKEQARFLESPFPVEAFMALELSPGALDGVRG
jgi:putative acetyltransferase